MKREIDPKVGEYWLTDWGVRKVIEVEPDFYTTVGEQGRIPLFEDDLQKQIPYGAMFKIHVGKFFQRPATQEEIEGFEQQFPSKSITDRIEKTCNDFRIFWIKNHKLSLEKAFWRWYSGLE